ncbi:ATPase, T2SS/T4P/T4SS family [Fusibacter tunisiensis]|uniref:Pilus assembly protein CpaF n=1 Tax=Fusibacter tunisiensis TaxID=1008308 RepID=A0ABS2MNL1_9FIRM|nr:ATPase, T2SS/T4P/T4SS family [Fusibacter tunisiensis]MBM7560981.1 pilus assembly protein CpaF [Fusibacter tunisiensis]
MGMIQSIHEPLIDYKIESTGSLMSQLLDEIVMAYEDLIADVEEGKVNAGILHREIEKKVDACKGVFNAETLKKEIFDTIYGYGLLQPYIEDPEISDIDVPRYDYILIRKKGVLQELNLSFESEVVFERFCRVLVIRHGGVINLMEAHCRVSDRVNKLRINVSMPPRNTTGASLTIRKHKADAYTYQELIQLGMLDNQSKTVLETVDIQKKNILICGKGASGKTTLLRTLIDFGDKMERLLICESDTEIYPQKKNVIVQRVQKNKNSITDQALETLLKEGLTMSLDTYCIGEITGAEAWSFVKAGYTDHRIMGTIHSKSCQDALNRLLMLVENETRMDEKTIREMVLGSMNVVIYMKNFQVNEIFDASNHRILYQKGVNVGDWDYSGIEPFGGIIAL